MELLECRSKRVALPALTAQRRPDDACQEAIPGVLCALDPDFRDGDGQRRVLVYLDITAHQPPSTREKSKKVK